MPVGSVHYFAMTKPPVGYRVADGSAVEPKAYPGLFSAIGTRFGDGDGRTTFDLPDLIGRFAQGNVTPGTVMNAGLPNIVEGFHLIPTAFSGENDAYGACSYQKSTINVTQSQLPADVGEILELDASRFNPVYGSSNTVQPPALTLLPCIEAFQP